MSATATCVSPAVSWEGEKVVLTSPYRKGVERFFYDLVTRGLVPGKELSVSRFLVENCRGVVRAEMTICFENAEEKKSAEIHAPFLEKEILLGASSLYYAKKILEMKGLSHDDKMSIVQEKVGRYIRRFPKRFGYDLFKEMQHLFLLATEEFKVLKASSALASILLRFYHMRREEGAVHIKCRQALLPTPFGMKVVTAVFGKVELGGTHALFDERHFQAALPKEQVYIPGSGLFVAEGSVVCFYAELEGKANVESYLRREIPFFVEQLVSPVFMPRNEEEVMRSVVTLANELRFAQDLPQVMVSLHEQSAKELSFTVVVVRLVKERWSVEERLRGSSFVLERIKRVGLLRKRYPKEAVILRVVQSGAPFLRRDYSVDFLQVRKAVLKQVEEVFGPVRDYNGGMLEKQRENFAALQDELKEEAEKHPLLLQNFFYSIAPAHMSATCDPKKIGGLFRLLLQAIEQKRDLKKVEGGHQYVIGASSESGELLSFKMQIRGCVYTGQLLTFV